MASLNKVVLIGHMTADAELKQTPSGVSVCSFSIGVTRRYTKAGETPQSDFISIVAWRSTAEFITKYFRKGDAICICGQIQTRSWTASDGSKRYLRAERMRLPHSRNSRRTMICHFRREA